MLKKIFYQSSLPRAGSTLFQNIIHQNPEIYATPTDGVLELIFAARGNYTDSLEFKAQDSKDMEKGFIGFCKEGMGGFYSAITDRPYVMSKSRGWGIHYDFLKQIHHEPKIICLIRDLRDIFTSMEKNFRKSQLHSNPILNWAQMQGTTTPKRIDVWAASPPVGLAIERLNEIIRQGIDSKILFIKYEDLCLYPENIMKKVYEYLEIDSFNHDFINIEQFTKEDDEVYGVFGDHTIRPTLEMKPSDSRNILGRDVCDWIYTNYKWFYDKFGYKK